MFRVMLCGAHDTTDVKELFQRVVTQFGAESMWYREGTISYFNGTSANWVNNSSASVAEADLCVFVIVRTHGRLTWDTELREALNLGKSFLILCLQDTYESYLTIRTKLADTSAVVDPNERNLYTTLSELESPNRQLTIVPYTFANFREVLRRQMSERLRAGLAQMEERNRRAAILGLMSDPMSMGLADLALARQVAIDELEDKQHRKPALLALAARGAATVDDTLALIRSTEQGVQRLAFENLDRLHIQRPIDPLVLAECVEVANESDVGLIRRLIPALLRMDVADAFRAFASLNQDEVGTRTRIAREILARERDLAKLPADARAVGIELVRNYVDRDAATSLKSRCSEFLDRQSET